MSTFYCFGHVTARYQPHQQNIGTPMFVLQRTPAARLRRGLLHLLGNPSVSGASWMVEANNVTIQDSLWGAVHGALANQN